VGHCPLRPRPAKNFELAMKTLSTPAPVRQVLLVLALLAAIFRSHAQRPAHYVHGNADMDRAKELFDKEKYAAAQYEFQRVIDRIPDRTDMVRTEAEYFSALAAVRLFHDDAGHRLIRFVEQHPEAPHTPAVRFELFKHVFAQKKWKESLQWSELVERGRLDADEMDEFRFKRGYALFQQDQREPALHEFAEVRAGTGTYANPAAYYTAHIQYERGNYATALPIFQRLQGDESFSRVVPYYIAEILFLQGKYDELDAYVKPLLADPQGTKRMHEINRLAGEANYRSGKYAEALPYLEKSSQRVGVGREDRYILGYTYYRTNDCRKALNEFNLVATGTDTLAQLAAYHMADCYLKLNEKNFARNAFRKAYEMGKDEKVTEDALFNYAKLAYELSFDPYHEAIRALQNYMKEYPRSARRDEAYEFLLSVYLKTRNYEAALAALDEIKNKNIRLQEAYQKLAFDRGVELYEGRKYKDAAAAFELALRYPVNQQVNARSHFWMGESYYGMNDLQAALRKYDALRNSPGSYASDLYEQAGYSMGYAYFKMKQYDEAAVAFRRFVGSRGGKPEQRADALLRIGDSYFVSKDNLQAIKWYDDAIRAGATDKDYAQYQKGICYGLQRQFPEKISTLKGLLAERPNSRYAADAKYQLGETYINMGNDNEAMAYYGKVVAEHPNSPHVRESMLQSALIHKRQGNTAKALEEFKAVVAKYPTMDGSRNALAGIESIYVEQGRVSEYEAYLKSLSFVDPSLLDLDDKYYQSAAALYFEEKCPQAIGAFGDYLTKFPNGAYSLNALFYRGDCHYKAGNYAQALPDLEAVVARNGGDFMESALFGASDILFRDKRWAGALEHFKRLETVASSPKNVLAAQVGQMRSQRELGRMNEAAQAAEKVLANTGATADLKAEAGVVAAKGLLAQDQNDAAYDRFKSVSTTSTNQYGAEAKFHMAYIRHLQARYKDAEKEVFELVQRYPAYDHWKARSFILLGDVYVQMNDRFQAKATLQSVINNSTEPELVAQARQRLEAIERSEVEQTTPTPQEEMNITLPGNQ
jgi:TolA-binding protein